jgi:hypothetical protein
MKDRYGHVTRGPFITTRVTCHILDFIDQLPHMLILVPPYNDFRSVND